MVKQIEDPLFSGPYKSIKNWDQLKKRFRDASATLHAHKIGNNSGQTKKAFWDVGNQPPHGYWFEQEEGDWWTQGNAVI